MKVQKKSHAFWEVLQSFVMGHNLFLRHPENLSVSSANIFVETLEDQGFQEVQWRNYRPEA
jgi:hypothetical protein